MLSKEQLKKATNAKIEKLMSQRNMANYKLRRTQTQPKWTTIKTCQLRKIEKDSMNTVVEKNRSKTQRSGRKNDQ